MYHKVDEYSDIIKTSGFNTLVIWSVHISETGNLILNESLIFEDGEYVGREEWPEELENLLEAPTSIERIELSVGSFGVPDWEMIQQLVETEGTGPTSTLYKNFAKIKEILPISAINNDDESNYDVDSTVAFSKMLIDLGFNITFAPYTFQSFWGNVYDELEEYSSGSVDEVYVQAYAGGTGNTPSGWNNLFDINVVPGLWGCTVQSPSQLENQFSGCVDNDLTWSGGSYDAEHLIYFGTSPILTDIYFQGSLTSSTYDPGTLEKNRTYYWRVDQRNETGLVTGTTWSFTTEENVSAPGLASNPSPETDALEVRADVILSWDEGINTVSYDVYFGSVNPPPFVVNQSQSSFNPSDLDPLTTYYWQVNSVNSESTTIGDVWTFTTIEPNLAPAAEITVSSEFNNTYSKERLVDGIIGINGNGEWASLGEQTPTARLTWNDKVIIKKIVLYDRPNGIEKIFSGILEFSDGSTITVGELPDTGSALEISVDFKEVDYVEFRPIDAIGPNVGLAEFEVFGTFAEVNAIKDGSILDSDNDQAVTIFPNPTDGLTTIKIESEGSKVDYSIFSNDGKVIFESENEVLENNTIELNLKNITQNISGIYFLQVVQSEKITVLKIILN